MSLPRFSVNNVVLVNMLMLVLLVGGVGFACTLVREMFPESRPNSIAISAIYPAVQPEQIERSVTIKIEEAVRDVDGVEKVSSTVAEGWTSTTLTLFNNVSDVDAVLQEVQNEIDSLDDLPDDLEQVTVRKVEPTLPVIMVAVYGDGEEADLKRVARAIKDDLLELPGVSDVSISGLRDDEISVEIRPDKLREFNITFSDVAAAIRQTNLDVSAGSLKGERSLVSVRTLGEERRGIDLEDIEVRALPDGRVIRLRDVAEVHDQFVDTDVRSYWAGKRAANLIVQKTSDQDAIQISTMVKAYVAGKQGKPFDPYGRAEIAERPWYEQPLAILGVGISQFVDGLAGRPDPFEVYEESRKAPFRHQFELALHTDLARFVSGRLDLMVRNGKAGLALVVVCLMLFLNGRVAFWTAVGLPVSFMGTFVVMALFGVTINLLSMFGLIIVLGIIVDDAIVIGENIYRRVEEGMPPKEAAIVGAEEVQWPVVVAVLTTIASFLPIMFIRGQIGDFMRQLPLVVVAALSVSLIEALIILPAHLRHIPPHRNSRHATHPTTRFGRMLRSIGAAQERLMAKLSEIYISILRGALTWRYAALAGAMAAVMMSLGLFVGKTSSGYTLGNHVQWQFVQEMDAESMYAQIELPVGSNAKVVEDRLRVLSDAAQQIPEVKSVSMDVATVTDVATAGAGNDDYQSHLGQLWVELLAADERDELGLRSSQEVLAELRKTSESLSGVNSVRWSVMNGGPGGRDIEVRISGGNFDEIRAVAAELKEHLKTYNGVADLDDNLDEGKRELQLTLRDAARPTGVTKAALGAFVREATHGAEARRISRNREDVKIMVRYPEEYRQDVYHIESMWLPVPSPDGAHGGWTPLSEIARVEETRGYTQIHRWQQNRTITVTGDIDEGITRTEDVFQKVRSEFLPRMAEEYPLVGIEFLGSQEEQGKAFGSLRLAFPVAMLLVFTMLCGLFRSYVQPLVVMAAIPFGIQGAIIGHWITGEPMTILSFIGLVALTGIVVNDSLVLVDFINKRVRAGLTPFEASLEGAALRLRPIILTTVTTVAGLTPLMFERSFQAKFLIPMAVTLTFGLIFATVLTLLIVPVLNMIFFDFRNGFSLLVHGKTAPEHERDEMAESSEMVAT